MVKVAVQQGSMETKVLALNIGQVPCIYSHEAILLGANKLMLKQVIVTGIPILEAVLLYRRMGTP